MSEKNNNAINISDSKVRVGIHSTNLMFGEVRKDGSFNYDGIDLSLSEQRALFAIQKMLDKTNYEGNAPERMSETDNSFKYTGKLPRITFTPSQFLEAYGLERRKTSRGYMEYSSNERKTALDALNSLSVKRFKIIYKRHRFQKSEVIDRIETESTLLRIYKGYFGLTADEDRKLDNGSDINVDSKLIIGVEVCPVIVDQIDKYFILLDPHLHTIAKELVGKKKQSKYPALFINWLTVKIETQRRNKTTGAELKIGVKKLAVKLRMYDLLKDYQWKKIREIFEECFAVGRGMGLLSDAVIEDDIVKISLPKKDGISTHIKRNLCPNKTDSLPIKNG